MRPVGDHHVDRPGVEAWRHVKLTGTNWSIGFFCAANIIRIYAHSIQLLKDRNPKRRGADRVPTASSWWRRRRGNTRSHSELGS